jgi:ATP-binding cassette subfamily B protein
VLQRLLVDHLRPYRRLLGLIVVLQFVQTMATLSLPSLNSDIIDKGVVRGDTDLIWRIGGIMLAVSLVQVAFSSGATSCSAMSF